MLQSEISNAHTLTDEIRSELIGNREIHDGPWGPRPLVYADYTASGRAVERIENYIRAQVLPTYANTHTEASLCGQRTGFLREAARTMIAEVCNAGDEDAVIFTGGGATAAINKLIALLDLDQGVGPEPLILLGPYEHHSNILPWRETGVEIRVVPEAETGGPDMNALSRLLEKASGRRVIASFAAASNVTGILTDVDAVSALLHRHGALALWDYAAGAPYLPIDMNPETPGAWKDAVFFSPHKFVGGPGASGVLILKRRLVCRPKPSQPGGGTVRFVSPYVHDYVDDLVAREEAGTPNIIGDIRAGLVMKLREDIGLDTIARRDHELRTRALEAWSSVSGLELLGNRLAKALPIFVFRIRNGNGEYVHHQLVTRMLSDVFGVQARGGCACAGPYAHQLLRISDKDSADLRRRILDGDELAKPGWVRLNLSYIMDDQEVDYIVDAVRWVANHAGDLEKFYKCDPHTARFTHRDESIKKAMPANGLLELSGREDARREVCTDLGSMFRDRCRSMEQVFCRGCSDRAG
ncbi:MAG: aminotransferase class V-fold PLP-dependent enzyme [Alphaproteobacteria bacterium]|nr:MAG: aminotransferase class V-fold PLP-dependent enzyme [Alphaproteobacteria bacterium]